MPKLQSGLSSPTGKMLKGKNGSQNHQQNARDSLGGSFVALPEPLPKR